MNKKTNSGGAKAPSAKAPVEDVDVLTGEELDETEEVNGIADSQESDIEGEENIDKEEDISIIESLKRQVAALTKLVTDNIELKKLEKMNGQGSREIEKSAKSDIELTKAALDQEKKFTIVIPKGKHDPVGAIETVTINGLRFEIIKGTPVEVPESIYITLLDYLEVDFKAGQNTNIITRSKEIEDNLN